MARSITPARAVDDDAPKLPPRHSNSPWLKRGLMFLACALAANALVGERGLSETLRVRREVRRMNADIARLRVENAQLADYARRLASDARMIEAIARSELGMIRKGEILIVLKDVPSR